MRGDNKSMRMAGAMAVVAGRAARPCDVCGRKRARLYCAADDAYLCDACDSSVHAANALALRHERVRLAPNGAPMKMDRRNNINTREPLPVHATPAPAAAASNKKKLTSRPSSNPPPSVPRPAFSAQHGKLHGEPTNNNSSSKQLREVKVELNHHTTITNDIEPSDDHFTAEELTGNANLLDESPSNCPTSVDDSSATPGCNEGMISEADFAHDFLVADPNDCNNNNNNNCTNHGTTTSSAGAGGGDVVDDDEEEEGVGNEWMELDLGHRDLSDDEYCLDLGALRESVSEDGAHDQSIAGVYGAAAERHGNDSKSSIDVCGLSTSSSRIGKPFKNIAGQTEWVKLEEGAHHNYNMPQAFTSTTTTTCKIEGLNDCDLRQVPSLRLNYADVLSSWPDRGMLWTDAHGSGNSRLVPDDSNSDGMGSCYDLGLVPDLSSAGCGGSTGFGHLATMYGGCGAGAGTGGGGEDSFVNAGNAREARVIRYREKRRTRLFSKKIRYEVRKLNAERRPRMKGRFVKRSPGREG